MIFFDLKFFFSKVSDRNIISYKVSKSAQIAS